MRRPLLLFLVAAAVAVAAGAACSSSSASSSPPGGDAGGSDASSDVFENTDVNIDVAPPAEAGGYVCWIPASGDKTQGLTDPVLLCTQDQVLGFVLQYAYVKGKGVMSTWSSTPPSYTAGSTHDWTDDLALAAAIGDFHCSATYYGSTANIAKYDSTLADLRTVLAAELPSATQSYDGALYYRMRSAGLAFTYVLDDMDATALAAAAEGWAANVAANFTTMVTPPASGGGNGDGGTDEGGADDAGPGDASAPPAPVALIGTPMGNGVVEYAPAQSIMAAAALLDMARLHAGDPDAGTNPATWTAIAQGTLSYVWNRGRDPVTGLFYQKLDTSSDPGHDALAAGGTPTSDALLTEVQGAAVLGLSRAMRALGAAPIPEGGVQPSAPYARWANQIVGSMTGLNVNAGGVGLFAAGTPNYPPMLCMGCGQGVEPPANPSAFLAGYVPSTGTTLTDVPVAGNVDLLGGFAFTTAIDGTAVPGCKQDPNLNVVSCNYENLEIRAALDEFRPDPSSNTIWPPHSNFLSVVTNQTGDVIQQAYLAAVSQNWGYASGTGGPSGDAGPGGVTSGASDYSTATNLAMIEALTQLWFARPNAPACPY